MPAGEDTSSSEKNKAIRTPPDWWKITTFAIGVVLSSFQVWTAAFGILNPQYQRGIHYACILFLLFFLYQAARGRRTKRSVPWYDVMLALAVVAINLYPIVFLYQIMRRAGDFSTLDGYVSLALILVTLEATRRVIGWPLVIISILAILYARYGFLIPGYFGHRGFDIFTISTHSVLSLEGVMGIPMAVATTFVFIFILFSSFLRVSGLGQFFINLAVSLVGPMPGGPAQIAVISSGLMGTISGSSTANVVGTGSFTIPLMKSIGYRPYFAGAVEAAASTGGQLMPPIMGAAAFIMAEFLGISYFKIALAAALPSLLYYSAVGMMVHKEAVRTGLKGIPRSQTPRFTTLMKESGHLVIPIVTIIYVLLRGYTPLFAGLVGVISCYGISFLRRSTRMGLKALLTAMSQGAEDAIPITTACACCGIIIGVVTLTGVGLKLGYGIVALAGGSLFFTLFFTMITSLLLGMGVPTTANYIITSTIAAPALIMLKIPPLAAHMFVFYFGIIADITPPVAVAAYTAAAIARAEPILTAYTATRLAIVAFLVPYFFVYNPFLLLIEIDFFMTLKVMIASFVSMFALSAAVSGYWRGELSIWARVPLFVAALSLLDQRLITDLAGLSVIGVIWVVLVYRERRHAAEERFSKERQSIEERR